MGKLHLQEGLSSLYYRIFPQVDGAVKSIKIDLEYEFTVPEGLPESAFISVA